MEGILKIRHQDGTEEIHDAAKIESIETTNNAVNVDGTWRNELMVGCYNMIIRRKPESGIVYAKWPLVITYVTSHELTTTQGAKKFIQFVEEGGHVFHQKAYWKDWKGEVPQAGDIVEIAINEDTTFVGKVLYRSISNCNPNVVRCFVRLSKD